MARTALEHALSPDWIDAVFEAERQRQYSRELMFSTVVELMTLVSLGLRPSLHAAARQMDNLPVSLASLYDKVNHTEPGILQALVPGSVRWSPWLGQFGGLAKLGSDCCQAANVSVPVAQYASLGVRPASVECGRRAL